MTLIGKAKKEKAKVPSFLRSDSDSDLDNSSENSDDSGPSIMFKPEKHESFKIKDEEYDKDKYEEQFMICCCKPD